MWNYYKKKINKTKFTKLSRWTKNYIYNLERCEFERVRDSVCGIKSSFPKIEIGHASRGNRAILSLDELDRGASVRSNVDFFRSTAQPFSLSNTTRWHIYGRVIAGKEFGHFEFAESFPCDCASSAWHVIAFALLTWSIQMDFSICEDYIRLKSYI